MKKHNGFKRTLAGVLAVLTVAGYLPANVGSFLTGGAGIVASAMAPDPITEMETLSPSATQPTESSLTVKKAAPTQSMYLAPNQDPKVGLSANAAEMFQIDGGSTFLDTYKICYAYSQNSYSFYINADKISENGAQNLIVTDAQGKVLPLGEISTGDHAAGAIQNYYKVEVGASDRVNIYFNKKNPETGDTIPDPIEWSANSFPNVSGSYKLMKDITLEEETTVKCQDITFDLNGHNIFVTTGTTNGKSIRYDNDAYASYANEAIGAGICSVGSKINITNSAEARGFIYADTIAFKKTGSRYFYDNAVEAGDDAIRFTQGSMERFRRFMRMEDYHDYSSSGGEENYQSELTISAENQNIVVTGFNCSAVYSYNKRFAPTTVNVKNVVFANNNGLNGAALYMESGAGSTSMLTAENCLFQGNSANAYGGAVYFRGTAANIEDCTFTGNKAVMCGAVFFGSTGEDYQNNVYNVYMNNVYMKNTTITNNTADRFGGVAAIPTLGGIYTAAFHNAAGSNVHYILQDKVVISGNKDKLSINDNAEDALLDGGDLYLYYDPDEERHADDWTAQFGNNIYEGYDALSPATNTIDISGLDTDSDIGYRLFKSTPSGDLVMLVMGVLTDALDDAAKDKIDYLKPSYGTPEGGISYKFAQKINGDNKLEVYKAVYTISDTLYFTRTLTEPTMEAVESAAESTFSNILRVDEFTDGTVLSNAVYAKLTGDDGEESVALLASIDADSKVYDGKAYNPAVSVHANCMAGFALDNPEYIQIITKDDGSKELVELGTDAPTEKGEYLISYSVLRFGTAIRNKYLYAPFAIGARAITDYVVVADINQDERIGFNEIFGGIDRSNTGENVETFDMEAWLQEAANEDNGATPDALLELLKDSDKNFVFRSLDDLKDLYVTGQEYNLRVIPFSVYMNEEGDWETVQLKETIMNEDGEVVEQGDFTVTGNKKTEPGEYKVSITAPEFVGKKEIAWAINKNKLTDYLIGVDVNHDGQIMVNELFGTLTQNPDSLESISAGEVVRYFTNGESDLDNAPAEPLIQSFNETAGEQMDEMQQNMLSANIKFRDLADLENVLNYDGKAYELQVYPFSVMKVGNDYITHLIDTEQNPNAISIGGTPSKVVAGNYVMEVQSDTYEIKMLVKQEQDENGVPSDNSPVEPQAEPTYTDTILVPWAIKQNESDAQFNKESATLEYTGKPANFYFRWLDTESGNGINGFDDFNEGVIFNIYAPNRNLSVKYYYYNTDKSIWVEGLPTELGTYQIAGVYNGTMSATGEVKQINRNVKVSSATMNLTIVPATVDVKADAQSEYGNKLADVTNISLTSSLTVDGKSIEDMVDVTAAVEGTTLGKGHVLPVGTHNIVLTITPKEGYKDALKYYNLGTDENGKRTVSGYRVTPKEITEDMVSFSSKYVKPNANGMVNPGEMTVKFDGYDVTGESMEFILESNRDYKAYGATQASGQAAYEMDLVGINNYIGVATVSWVVDTRSEVEITGKYAEVTGTSYDTSNKKLKFNARMAIPDDAVMTQLGIIATSNAAIKYDLTLDTAPEAGVTFVKATTEGLDGLKGTNYNWTKTNVGTDDVWYAVPYVCYNLNGEDFVRYGSLVKATANGVAPVEMATAEYVSATYTADNKKLKFNTFVTIPDGSTMDAIGICATKNHETAETLSTETPPVDGETYIKKTIEGLSGISETGYSWTKTKVAVGDNWFVKPYVTYTDADGVQQTVYGELKVVTAEAPVGTGMAAEE